jgi:hypothetical protein
MVKRYSMPIQNLSYSALMDAVSDYTKRFIRFVMVGGNPKEFQACRNMLDNLIRELKRRKKGSHDDTLQKQIANLTTMIGGKMMMN